ncbi:hypothetical protein [Acinetobacter sp. CWB-B33]|uniref:hypothetical protein n=1 Tax=Acinetobacter sp. CWB-B33 TaxID=2815724 RepID=UPI0031FEE221
MNFNGKISNWFLEEKQINWSERKIKTYEALRTISYNFIHSDEWLTEFRKWFDQVGELDFSLLKELVTSELLDENYQKAKENIERLMQQYKAYDIDSEFSKKLSNEIKEIIKFETIDNITFYCSILAEFNEMEEIKHIDDLVEIYLKNEFTLNRNKLLDKHYWYGNEENKFRKYIKKLLDNPIYFQQDDFVKIIRLFIDRGEIAFGADEVLAHLTKENLEIFILNEYPQNFKRVSLKVIIEVILDLYNYQNFDNKRDIQM